MILEWPLMVQTGLKDAIRIQIWGKTLVPRNILVSLASLTMGANCYCEAALWLIVFCFLILLIYTQWVMKISFDLRFTNSEDLVYCKTEVETMQYLLKYLKIKCKLYNYVINLFNTTYFHHAINCNSCIISHFSTNLTNLHRASHIIMSHKLSSGFGSVKQNIGWGPILAELY